MALIKCSECGTEISDKADSCIKCGAPISQIAVKQHKQDDRKCLTCNYKGQMKTWIRNYILPQIIAIVLLVAYLLPGLIFIGWYYKKYKCPNCGTIGKNVLLQS